jgi:hypothetical protein
MRQIITKLKLFVDHGFWQTASALLTGNAVAEKQQPFQTPLFPLLFCGRAEQPCPFGPFGHTYLVLQVPQGNNI